MERRNFSHLFPIQVIALLFGLFTASAHAGTAFRLPYYDSIFPNELRQGLNWNIQFSGESSFFPGKQIGGAISLGRHFGLFKLDAKVTYNSLTYGNVLPAPSIADAYYAPTDAAAEVLRLRSATDRWGLFTGELGLGMSARLMPQWLPLLKERARFGFGFGSATDSANSLSFLAFLYSMEAALQYQLGQSSRWSFELAVAFKTGVFNLAGGTLGSELNRLPVAWGNLSLGLVYSF